MSLATDTPVALVTGAARGIGAATAERLAKDGIRVMMTDLWSDIPEAVADLQAQGLSVSYIPADLSEDRAADRLVAAVIAEWGRIDILVNNAAFFGDRHSVLSAEPAEWQAIFDVNVFSAAALCRAAARDMAQRRCGAIVNVGSVQLVLPAPSYAAYVASKGAVDGMTRALAVELGNLGIRVNSVSPGVIGTVDYRKYLDEQVKEGTAPSVASLLGRVGRADEVAEAIVFLAGSGASFITGVTLYVDGGRSISRRSDPFQIELLHPLGKEIGHGQNPD